MTSISPLQASRTDCCGTLAMSLCGGALGAGLGAGAAALLTPIPPLGGAIFGATWLFSGHLINHSLDKMGCNPETTLGKILKVSTVIFLSSAIAFGVTSLSGFSMTLATGLMLAKAFTLTELFTILGLLCVVESGCAAMKLMHPTPAP